MSMQEVMSELFEHSDDPGRPHPAAQEMELRARWKALQQTYNFRPGDIVREKLGLGIMRQRDPLLFVRTLDSADKNDQFIIRDGVNRRNTNRLDCIVGMISDSGNTLTYFPHETSLLEPYIS